MTKTGINRLVSTFLNNVNDPSPGTSVANSVQAVPGQLGAVMELNDADAARMSSGVVAALTNVGNLYGGIYQYVQFYAGQSGTTVAGGPVYWQDPDNFVVTADVPTSGLGFAGVALNVPTKGNYAWILVAGKCACQPLDNTTVGSPAIGDVMVLSSIGRFDDVADPYATSSAVAALPAGQWIQAPVDATSTLYLAYVKFAARVAS